MKGKFLRWLTYLFIFSAALLGACLLSLAVGPSAIPFKKLFSCVISKSVDSIEYSIFFDIRLPRIILGIAAGGALSIVGVLLQGLFRNPLVEPYTLGISGGAALGVALSIILGLSRFFGVLAFSLSAFLGAVSVIMFLHMLSARKGIIKIQGFLLTGVMISFICSSLVMFIMAVSKITDLHGIIFWTMGSLGEPDGNIITIMLFISLAGLVMSYMLWPNLNAISLGEEEAAHLGIDVEKTKRAVFFLSSLLTGFAVSVCGIIGFVGLVVPHFVRLFAGTDHRITLILSYLAGAIFLILSDTVARTVISPLELPVGVITGIFGGLIFIYFLNKRIIER